MSLRSLGRTDVKELLETAREHFREGNYRIAESLLQQLVLADGKNPEIFHMMATIYYDQGKFNKAIKTFRRALEIDPTYTDASVGLSIILNDLGKYEEGKKVFVDAQEALAKKSTDSDPYIQEKLATKHDELGELYFQYKRYDEALEQYFKALSLSTRKADLKMKLVECFLKKDDVARAMKELKILVQEYPQFIPARLKLGLLYFNARKTVEAVQQWETVLLRDPEHPVAMKYLQMANETGSTLLT
jgi:tetratricopeptide (TPR) repeat protein